VGKNLAAAIFPAVAAPCERGGKGGKKRKKDCRLHHLPSSNPARRPSEKAGPPEGGGGERGEKKEKSGLRKSSFFIGLPHEFAGREENEREGGGRA